MTLGYSATFPDKTPTNFRYKILASDLKNRSQKSFLNEADEAFFWEYYKVAKPKLHTIRLDTHDRWQSGNRIHHVYHNRTPNRHCFLENTCLWVQNIKIINTTTIAAVNSWGDEHRIGTSPVVIVNGRSLSFNDVQTLAENDGFDTVDQFYKWFSAGDFNGKIIHWTNLKY